MKKLFAVLLALTLVLSMGTFALAAGDGTTETGSITITNAAKDAEYDLYRIFDLVSYDATNGTYSYKLSTKWKDFTNAAITVNENGYVEWALPDAENNGAAVNAFVKDAIAYAKNNNIDADANGKKEDKDGALTIGDLPLGYYLIDTSLGTLCSITTTKPNAEITEKNQKPDIDKFVQEDSLSANNTNDNGWGKINDADIDQTVYYKSTITVGEGATNYIMHDTMTNGLTFKNDIVVKLGETAEGEVVDASNYTVVADPDDDCTFEVKFKDEFIAGLAVGSKFTVYYSATLNENAIIVDKGNDNTVYLTYGEQSQFTTDEHTTRTFTWKIDVLKYTMDGDSKLSLPNAKFQLLGADGNAIKFTQIANTETKDDEGNVIESIPTYKVDVDGATDTIITDDTGKFIIVGLDEGTYKLHETEAPAGYNKLANDLTVIVTSEYDAANLADLSATYFIDSKAPATIEVENKAGSLLPETGGIGTTIFYIVGITLMLGAGIILISKKRMATYA